MTRPSIDDVLMVIAVSMAARSTCSRAKVGVVIALDGRVVSTGYNGAPAGLPHCNHECNCDGEWHGGDHTSDCPTISPCTTSVHAEVNAIAFAARHGVAAAGTTLYTTLSPCVSCAQLIINAGITDVVYQEKYRNVAGLALLTDAGVRTRQL
jgi:dCMP deaminase